MLSKTLFTSTPGAFICFSRERVNQPMPSEGGGAVVFRTCAAKANSVCVTSLKVGFIKPAVVPGMDASSFLGASTTTIFNSAL